jgi:hypothetical protein
MALSLLQASLETGYSEKELRSRIKEGSLPVTKVKNKYFIEEKDLLPHMKKSKSMQSTSPETERSLQDAPFHPKTEQRQIPILAVGPEAIQAFLELKRLKYQTLETEN